MTFVVKTDLRRRYKTRCNAKVNASFGCQSNARVYPGRVGAKRITGSSVGRSVGGVDIRRAPTTDGARWFTNAPSGSL